MCLAILPIAFTSASYTDSNQVFIGLYYNHNPLFDRESFWSLLFRVFIHDTSSEAAAVPMTKETQYTSTQ